MRAILWTTIYILSQCAQAESYDDHYLKQLTHARSPAQVEELRAHYEEFKITHAACRIQLHEHAAPIACYQALAMENHMGLYSVGKKKMLLAHLDQICERASIHLTTAAPSPGISARCRRALLQARRVLRYRQSEATGVTP